MGFNAVLEGSTIWSSYYELGSSTVVAVDRDRISDNRDVIIIGEYDDWLRLDEAEMRER
ncbi:hypothetical protein L484_009122 [Morus notabilis]|uniref:Uncharacterized protein n=1 Tax=Morus notabilis TaxID=981085 RepID=W9RG36_9ROSA|nr:hypothetical protein L484_009122 [Morus notabilis]